MRLSAWNFEILNINNKNLKKQFGFTLIEILITMSIIGILASVGMITFSQAQLASRDGKRKQDIRSLSTALELYYETQSTKAYPANITAATLVPNFINEVPLDPTTRAAYGYTPNTGTPILGYTLCARLENTADPDGSVNPSDCGAAGTYFRVHMGP